MKNETEMRSNPYTPGAGHMPPHLAGRENELKEFSKFLNQTIILENVILTGLRGVGKTVLLETFRPLAQEKKWLWIGTDLSEAASVSENNIISRLLTDLSIITSNIVIQKKQILSIGFNPPVNTHEYRLDYEMLMHIYNTTSGLNSDKLKKILEICWMSIQNYDRQMKGVIFAYDEAQTMSDHSKKEQYPLSLLLDVFQSIQRKKIPFMLVLTGLPTLFPKLVEARTYTERMFHVIVLDKLSEQESREAILKPIEDKNINFTDESVGLIVERSGGYPYFIQFICREAYEILLQKFGSGDKARVPIKEILMKLDKNFFAGRWAKATDRQRELLVVIANLRNCHDEFTVQEVIEEARKHPTKSFSSSHINQMLSALVEVGLIYKNRHGKYSFAVPLLGGFILRQMKEGD